MSVDEILSFYFCFCFCFRGFFFFGFFFWGGGGGGVFFYFKWRGVFQKSSFFSERKRSVQPASDVLLKIST